MENDEMDGVFDTIKNEERVDVPEPETKTNTEAEEAESSQEQETNTETSETETNTEEESTEEENSEAPEGQETQSTEEESTEHSQTEIPEESPDYDWTQTLPPPPADYAGPKPEVDENGTIINMTPEEYTRYTVELAKAEMRKEAYAQTVENRALDIAEKILPEMKTNNGVRQLVENARIASILSGGNIDTVQAARQVKEMLGITSTQIAEAQAKGAQNAKASITVQKNAALETSTPQKPDTKTAKDKELDRRLRAGDNDAFAQLFAQFEEDGKI